MQTIRRRTCSRVGRGELSRQLPTPTAIYARREALMAEIRSKLAEGDKMATYDMWIQSNDWLEYMFEHVADSEQTRVECLERPDGSYLVASPFLIFCLHWHAKKNINPFGCSIFRRGSPTTAALSPARAAGSASKAVPFLFILFYCFQIFWMWCLHDLAPSWCSNRIFVVFVYFV